MKQQIAIVGIGSGGCSIVKQLEKMDNNQVYFYLDSDEESLKEIESPNKILLKTEKVNDQKCEKEIKSGFDFLGSRHLDLLELDKEEYSYVCLVTGLGGGTGGGATIEVAKFIASFPKEVVVFATMPFGFEGETRRRVAQECLDKIKLLKQHIVVFDNDTLIEKSGSIKAIFDERARMLYKKMIDFRV